jgi:hypothetical protein
MKNKLPKFLYSRQILVIPTLVMSISACSSQQTVGFSVIKESKQCHIQSAGISQLLDKKDQEKATKALTGSSTSQARNTLEQLFDTHIKTEHLYLVSQGKKPSAGYGFNVTGPTGSLSDNTLTLPISFTSPAPDSMVAQVITSPCLVLGIDSSAQYNQLIIDKLELKISN